MAADTGANVEAMRRAFDAYNAGDVAGALASMHPDLELHAAPGLVNSGDFHGHDGFIAWVTQWNEAWESFVAEPLSIEPVDERWLIAEVRQTGEGAGSGIEVELTVFWAFEISEGLARRAHIYLDREQAMAAIERFRAERSE